MYVYMKVNTSVSLDVSLLAEVRGVRPDFNLSAFVEEKLREFAAKKQTAEQNETYKLKCLSELKNKVFTVSQLKPEEFKGAVRKAKFLGLPTRTTNEKLDFWNKVLDLIQEQEVSPAPLPEGRG